MRAKSSCERAQRLLTGWRAGWLNPSEKIWVETHLATCPTCEAERRLDGRLVTALTALPQAQPSSISWAEVSARRLVPTLPLHRLWTRSAFAFAALTCAALFIVLAHPPNLSVSPAATPKMEVAAPTQETEASFGAQARFLAAAHDAFGDPNRAFLLQMTEREGRATE